MIVVKRVPNGGWCCSSLLAVGAIGAMELLLTRKPRQQSSAATMMCLNMVKTSKWDISVIALWSLVGLSPPWSYYGNELGCHQMGGQNGQDGQGGPGGRPPPQGKRSSRGPQEGKSIKKPSNADGTTKDDKNSENNSKNNKFLKHSDVTIIEKDKWEDRMRVFTMSLFKN